ncbi:MAG: preprotein translocase subunit SecG [Acidobacteriota bacterium]
MFTLLVVLHVLASIILILVVLLQSGKAGDLASAFGGGGSQTAFGTRSATTLLTKATTVAAVIFMFTSLSLSILSVRSSGGTVMEEEPAAGQTQTPFAGHDSGRSQGDSSSQSTAVSRNDSKRVTAQVILTQVPEWWNLADTPS